MFVINKFKSFDNKIIYSLVYEDNEGYIHWEIETIISKIGLTCVEYMDILTKYEKEYLVFFKNEKDAKKAKDELEAYEIMNKLLCE